MREFMLKINGGEGWTEPFSRYPEMLRPASIASERVEGWGSHRIRVDGAEVAFSDEDSGFQVILYSDTVSHERANEIMQDIAANIRSLTGATTKVIAI